MKQYLCKVEDIPQGRMKAFKHNNRKILVARKDNEFFALHNACPHQGAALSDGSLSGTNLPSKRGEFCYGKKGEVVRCPWHNHEFDLTSGESIHDPKGHRVKNYRLEIEGEDIFIDM